MKKNNKQSGLSILGIIFFTVIIIFVLSYFNVSLKSVVESPTAKDNISYVKGGTETFWQTYLEKPAHYLWNDVWINIFWKGFILNMERIRDGQHTDTDSAANNLQVNP